MKIKILVFLLDVYKIRKLKFPSKISPRGCAHFSVSIHYYIS